MKKLALVATLLIASLIFTACGGGGGSNGEQIIRGSGNLSVVAIFEDSTRTVPGYADTLRVTVTPPAGVSLPLDFPNPFLLTRQRADVTLADIKASAQPYVLDMEALTDGAVVGTVQRNVVVVQNEVTEIDVSANLESEIDSIAILTDPLLRVGSNSLFTAFALDDQGATLFTGNGFTWTSSIPSVLTFSQEAGVATANGTGLTQITAHLLGSDITSTVPFTPIAAPGSLITFTSDDIFGEIYVMDADGGNQTRLTLNGQISDTNPVFSPDGTKIAFNSARDGNTEIYIMDTDGGNQTRLTNNDSVDVEPSFSPDGSQIVFMSHRDGNDEIYVMDLDGSNPIRLTNNDSSDRQPAFSPDGTKIAFQANRDGNREIYMMDADGQNQINLTNDEGSDADPSFSPDGSRIAFGSFRNSNTDIYVMAVDGNGLARLTSDSFSDREPSFSPDGSKIAFISDRDDIDDIFIMNADGSNETNITNDRSFLQDPSFN